MSVTDYWNTIGKQNPQTDSVHDHLINCQAERELSSLLRNTAEFRKEVTCRACAAMCSPESKGVSRAQGSVLFKTALKVLWEMRGNMWAFKFSLVGPGRGCGSQVAQTSRLQEGRGTKKGEDGKHNDFLADSASPWCFMEVAWDWGFDGCSARCTGLRWEAARFEATNTKSPNPTWTFSCFPFMINLIPTPLNQT